MCYQTYCDAIVVARRSFARSSDSSLSLYGLHPHETVTRIRRAKAMRPKKGRLRLLRISHVLAWAPFVVLTGSTGARRQDVEPHGNAAVGYTRAIPGLVFVAINAVSRPSQGEVGQPAEAVLDNGPS